MCENLTLLKKSMNEYIVKGKIDNKKEQNIVQATADVLSSDIIGITLDECWDLFNNFGMLLANMCYFRWQKFKKYKLFGFKSTLLKNLKMEDGRCKM